MGTYKFSMPTPCHESWEQMTPTEQGRYCQHCEKIVVDFSKMTDTEVITYFKKNGKCCGRFATVQLDREMSTLAKRSFIPAAMFAAFIAAVVPESGKAQQRQVAGVIKDAISGYVIPGATIIYGPNKGKVSNTDGAFCFETSEEKVTLEVASVGYDRKKIELNKTQLERISEEHPLEIKLSSTSTGLMEIVIVEKGRSHSWFRRLFRY